MSKSVFVGAVGQHVGKTSTCLGLRAAAQRTWAAVQYYKPVGQLNQSGNEVDSDLFGTAQPGAVRIGPKTTQSRHDPKAATRRFRAAYERMAAVPDSFTLIEGSGHMGVGGVLGHNNAQVAAALGVPVVLVANGGVGSTVDHLLLNAALCAVHGADLVGCVLNKVDARKMDRIEQTTKPLLARQGVPVLAVVPDLAGAELPTFLDLTAVGAVPVSNPKTNGARFETFELATMDVDTFFSMLKPPVDEKRRCLILHASRPDHVLSIAAILERLDLGSHYALLLTGPDSHTSTPSNAVTAALRQSPLSIYRVACSTLEAVDRIRTLRTKLTPHDPVRAGLVTDHYARYVQPVLACL